MKKIIIISLFFFAASNLFSEEQWGEGFAIELSSGLVGQYAPINISLIFPRPIESLTIGTRASFSIPSTRGIDYDNDGNVIGQFLPVIISASIFAHLGTPVF